MWTTISRLMEQHLTPGVAFAGFVGLVFILFATLISKDMRISIYMFMLAVILLGTENPVLHTVFYILRWLILGLITIRVLLVKAQVRLSLAHILFLLWTAAAMFSVIQAPTVGRGVVFGIVYVLCFFVFFVLLGSEIETEEQVHKWFRMFIFLSWTLFFLSSVACFFDTGARFITGQGRMAGIFGNPHNMSRTLVFAGTLFVWDALRRKGQLFLQLLYYGAAGGCLFLVFLSGSRGPLGGFAIVMAVLAVRYRAKMGILIIPVLLAGAFYIVPKVMVTSSDQFVGHLTTFETPARDMLFKEGVQRFRQRPVMGWGLGSVSDPEGTVCSGFVSFHNSYLDFLVEFGLPGFLVVITALLYTYIRIWKLALIGAKSTYIKDVAWFIVATLTSLFVWTSFDPALASLARLTFYWLLILMVLTDCLVRINKQQVEYDFVEEYYDEVYDDYHEQMQPVYSFDAEV